MGRLPSLHERLGPVVSLSSRLAARIANTIRAGYAAEGFEEVDSCRTILLRFSEQYRSAMLERMQVAGLEWKSKIVVLCDERLDCRELSRFQARGAAAASLCPVEGFDEKRYLVEGDAAAVRELKRMLEAGGARILEIRAGSKPLYLAATVLASDLLVPVIWAAGECLRTAGVAPAAAESVLSKAVQQALRGYQKAGRKSWRGHLAVDDREVVLGQLAALESVDSELAAYFRTSAEAALRLFARESQWIRPPAPRVHAVRSGA